jgi:ABC-type uncharacterized transport system substrate-binding protein
LIRRAVAAVTLIMSRLIAAPPADTHPHVFIDNPVTFVFDAGKVTALRLHWVFDDIFSDDLLNQFDADGNGTFDKLESDAVGKGVLPNLKLFHYFTYVWADGKELEAITPTDFVASADKKRIVTFEMKVPLPKPVDPRGQALATEIYDHEFYVEVTWRRRIRWRWRMPRACRAGRACVTIMRTPISAASSSHRRLHCNVIDPLRVPAAPGRVRRMVRDRHPCGGCLSLVPSTRCGQCGRPVHRIQGPLVCDRPLRGPRRERLQPRVEQPYGCCPPRRRGSGFGGGNTGRLPLWRFPHFGGRARQDGGGRIFLGNAARPAHGLLMALWIALSHVLGAVVVAFLAHWLLRQITMSPIEQNHWIRMISFGAIALIGAWMLTGEWRRLRTGKPAAHACAHDHHDHGHHHHHGHGARHRGLLAIAAGFVPCSGAILILTFAIANGILVSGLVTVVAIALGMALTLGGLGLASMLVRHQVVFRMAGRGGATRWLGLIGPLLILVIGGLLFLAELSIIVVTSSA